MEVANLRSSIEKLQSNNSLLSDECKSLEAKIDRSYHNSEENERYLSELGELRSIKLDLAKQLTAVGAQHEVDSFLHTQQITDSHQKFEVLTAKLEAKQKRIAELNQQLITARHDYKALENQFLAVEQQIDSFSFGTGSGGGGGGGVGSNVLAELNNSVSVRLSNSTPPAGMI